MDFIKIILPYFQIVVAVVLVTVILLQQRGTGLGGAFGGGGATYHTKRGFEKLLFVSTIVLAIVFALSAFIALLIR